LSQSNPQIQYLYCGEPYQLGFGINADLLEDGIHPNAQGLALLAACIKKDVGPDMAYDISR
jgi:lysophospholipase L1-like esterase